MGATPYPDSSFLVSLVSADARSSEARAFMEHSGSPLLFTPLHRIEVRNALRNADARGALNDQDLRVALQRLEDDLRDGFLVHQPLAWGDVLRRADSLSEKHAAIDGQRTIDLLHVAAALECGARLFLSFDQRQRKLAKAVGLKVKP